MHPYVGATRNIIGEVTTLRATITVDEELLRELLVLTQARNRTAAINAAIEAHVRRLKIEGLLALAGKVDILSNEEIEAADLEEAERATSVVGEPEGARA